MAKNTKRPVKTEQKEKEFYVLLNTGLASAPPAFDNMDEVVEELYRMGWEAEGFNNALFESDFILLRIKGTKVEQLSNFKAIVPEPQFEYTFG